MNSSKESKDLYYKRLGPLIDKNILDCETLKEEVEVLRNLHVEHVLQVIKFDDLNKSIVSDRVKDEEHHTEPNLFNWMNRYAIAIAKEPRKDHSDIFYHKYTIALDVAQGMNFLHSRNILHKNLKPTNILIYKDSHQTRRAKINDFGLSDLQALRDKSKTVTQAFWKAPETLLNATHTEASDVYSFGIVLWQLFSLKKPYPFDDKTPWDLFVDEIVEKKVRPDPLKINTPYSATIAQLVTECWNPDPDLRPSFSSIINRLWVSMLSFFLKDKKAVEHVHEHNYKHAVCKYDVDLEILFQALTGKFTDDKKREILELRTYFMGLATNFVDKPTTFSILDLAYFLLRYGPFSRKHPTLLENLKTYAENKLFHNFIETNTVATLLPDEGSYLFRCGKRFDYPWTLSKRGKDLKVQHNLVAFDNQSNTFTLEYKIGSDNKIITSNSLNGFLIEAQRFFGLKVGVKSDLFSRYQPLYVGYEVNNNNSMESDKASNDGTVREELKASSNDSKVSNDGIPKSHGKGNNHKETRDRRSKRKNKQ